MSYSLLPLYAIGALMFLYVLVGIARDAWELLKYEPPAEPLEPLITNITPLDTPFMRSLKELNNV